MVPRGDFRVFVRKPLRDVQRHRGDPGNHCDPVSTRAVAARSAASVPNPDHLRRGCARRPWFQTSSTVTPGQICIAAYTIDRRRSGRPIDDGDRDRVDCEPGVLPHEPRRASIRTASSRSKAPHDGVAARRSTVRCRKTQHLRNRSQL
jgi:hypothetical protein